MSIYMNTKHDESVYNLLLKKKKEEIFTQCKQEKKRDSNLNRKNLL